MYQRFPNKIRKARIEFDHFGANPLSGTEEIVSDMAQFHYNEDLHLVYKSEAGVFPASFIKVWAVFEASPNLYYIASYTHYFERQQSNYGACLLMFDEAHHILVKKSLRAIGEYTKDMDLSSVQFVPHMAYMIGWSADGRVQSSAERSESFMFDSLGNNLHPRKIRGFDTRRAVDYYPDFINRGEISVLQRGYADAAIYGIDIETNAGNPISMQLYSEDPKFAVSKIFWVNYETITDTFIKYIDKFPSYSTHLMFAHFAKFDVGGIFSGYLPQLLKRGGMDFAIGKWTITGNIGSPTFVRLRDSERKVTVQIFDSYLWFQTSLDAAAKIVCPGLPKLARPLGIGKRDFSAKDTAFVAYAMRDSEVGFHLGKSILALHQKHDITPSPTLASMASRIFRKDFLKYPIVHPHRMDWIEGALQSYHGGKNHVLRGQHPRWHYNVASLDISSAYPWAMTQLPSFSYPELYRKSNWRPGAKGQPLLVRPIGAYCVTGYAKDCDWPCLFSENFQPIRGPFTKVWMSGFEINEAIRKKEVTISELSGFFYDAGLDRRPSPFTAYVDEFYRLKEEATDKSERSMYKLILNSLYGKFIQTRETAEYDENREEVIYNRPKEMFHPLIASSITAMVRAYIHDIEHTFKSLHTATDGVFVPNTPDIHEKLAAFNGRHGVGDGLGSLKFEVAGDLCLVRNKTYILYTDRPYKLKGETEEELLAAAHAQRSLSWAGLYRAKAARHGFQGTFTDLEQMMVKGHRSYQYEHVNTARESLHRGLVLNQFVKKTGILRVPLIKQQYRRSESKLGKSEDID